MKMAVSIYCKLGEPCSCAGPQLVVPKGARGKGCMYWVTSELMTSLDFDTIAHTDAHEFPFRFCTLKPWI